MSLKEERIVNCPKCGQKLEFIRWISLNIDENPEEKLKLLENEFGKVRCANCQKSIDIMYDFLYHDMHGKYMVGVDSDYSEALTQLGAIRGYKYRIADNKYHLAEIVRMFDAKLNSVAVEIAKELLRRNQKYSEDEKIIFHQLCGEKMSFIVPDLKILIETNRSMYDDLLKNKAIIEMEMIQGFMKVDRNFILDMESEFHTINEEMRIAN